jgi:exosortase A-associated hydrolase 1
VNIAVEEPLIFHSARQQCVGVLHHAEGGGRRPGVLIVVGGPQYRVGSHRQFILMARSLARAGYPVLRFDYRGMGDSPGEMQTFEEAAADIHSAIETFSSSLPGMPGIVLWGLCDGASATLMHGVSDARVHGLILANPWVRTTGGEAKAYVQQYYGRRFLQRSFWKKLLAGRLNVVKALRDLVATVRASRGTLYSANAPRDAAVFWSRSDTDQ